MKLFCRLILVFVGRKPKHPRDSFGAWLHHLRKEMNLTQQALSDLTGIQQRTIAHWERTGRLAGRKEILTLAKTFKISASELLREKHQSTVELVAVVKPAQATGVEKKVKRPNRAA